MFARSEQEFIEYEEAAERRQETVRRHHARMQMEMFGPECPYCTGHDGAAVYGEDGEERCTMCATGVRS